MPLTRVSGRDGSLSIRRNGSEARKVTILLDGTSGTRTSRWLKGAPQSAVRHISTIGVIGAPIAFVVARQYERGKASFYGIPEEFVRVGPIDALAPFIAIAGLLWLLFIAMHEVSESV